MSTSHPGPSIEGVVFPTLTLLTIILSIAPFIWHIKNRNLAASSLIFWIVLLDMFYFINALIWPNDNLDSWWRGYGLCDFEVKLQVAVTIGIPTSLVCVMRNLAKVLDTDRTVLRPTTAQRRRQYAIDSLLCFGAPIYMIIIHYIVQNIRYYIFTISGCVPGFDNSWPSIVLVHIWSPFFSVVTVYYSSELRHPTLGEKEILTRPSHRSTPHAQIPQRLCRHPQCLKFRSYQIPLPTALLYVLDPHCAGASSPVLCPLQKYDLHSRAIQLESGTWTSVVGCHSDSDRRNSDVRSLDPARGGLYSLRVLWAGE